MPMMSKDDICRLIPHDGAMCLLETVERWDQTQITCRALSHGDVTNPLRRSRSLQAICGLEYAAQAMAVHVGLLEERKKDLAGVGYLGAVKDLMLRVDRLDDLKEALTVQATRLIGQAGSYIYTFCLSAEGRELLTGRASIFLKDLEPQP